MPNLIIVKKSQELILQDSEFLRNELASLQRRFSVHLVPKMLGSTWVFICGSISMLSLIGLLFISLKDYKARATSAHKRQQEAENSQKIEQQKNSINQKAIIRLMNELQEIANGNLTQQATVDANITGAIADFINYTVEELKGLVQRVQSTANQATQAFNNVQTTSLQLLSSTSQQAQQIEISAKAIENIAKNMHDMADKTGQSMVDAQDAIRVTREGQDASQRAISGMQAIRVQIQDTSKHIKRLGESSLQISEITDLIDNITQQTHILAINAAIQAANAGESGRGFSVIAQEIQNLAEKSAQATQQIGQLISTIQVDVQSAGSAMEHSIQGVVEGSQLTDAMDNALVKIQETNQKLVHGMEIFANDMSQESHTANYVSENIKQLLQLTEQTLQGTTHTSESIKTLSNIMKKLEQSVSRFTVV
jgi:twitching motility protein PilJ